MIKKEIKIKFFTSLISLLIISSLLFSFPLKAKAQWITTDPGQIANQLTEFFVKGIVRAMAKRVLDKIVDQTITYIQGGGKPKFITNYKNFFKETADEATGQALVDIVGAGICSPYLPTLNLFLSKAKFAEQVECTLSEIKDNIKENIKNIASNLENGDWNFWLKIHQVSQNAFGATLLALDKIDQETSKAKESAKTKALAGKGYTGDKVCRQPEKHYICNIYDKYGKLIAEGVDVGTNSSSCASPDPKMYGEGAFGISQGTKMGCAPGKGEIVTPGSFAGALVSRATGDQSFGWLLSTREVQDYVIAISDALISRAIKEAKKGVAKGLAYVLSNSEANENSSINLNIGRTSQKLSLSGLKYKIDTNIRGFEENLPIIKNILHAYIMNYFAFRHIPAYAVSPLINAYYEDNNGNRLNILTNTAKAGLREGLYFYYTFIPQGKYFLHDYIVATWNKIGELVGRYSEILEKIEKLKAVKKDFINKEKHFEFFINIPIKKITIIKDETNLDENGNPTYTIETDYENMKFEKNDNLDYQELGESLSALIQFENYCGDFKELFEGGKLDTEKLYLLKIEYASNTQATSTIPIFNENNLITNKMLSSGLTKDSLPTEYDCYLGADAVKYYDLTEDTNEFNTLNPKLNSIKSNFFNNLSDEEKNEFIMYRNFTRQLYIAYRINMVFKSKINNYLQEQKMLIDQQGDPTEKKELYEELRQAYVLLNGKGGGNTPSYFENIFKDNELEKITAKTDDLKGLIFFKTNSDRYDTDDYDLLTKDYYNSGQFFTYWNQRNANNQHIAYGWWLCNDSGFHHCTRELYRYNWNTYPTAPIPDYFLTVTKDVNKWYWSSDGGNAEFRVSFRIYWPYYASLKTLKNGADYGSLDNAENFIQMTKRNSDPINSLGDPTILHSTTNYSVYNFPDGEEDFAHATKKLTDMVINEFASLKRPWPVNFNEPIIYYYNPKIESVTSAYAISNIFKTWPPESPTNDINYGFLNLNNAPTEWHYWVKSYRCYRKGYYTLYAKTSFKKETKGKKCQL